MSYLQNVSLFENPYSKSSVYVWKWGIDVWKRNKNFQDCSKFNKSNNQKQRFEIWPGKPENELWFILVSIAFLFGAIGFAVEGF